MLDFPKGNKVRGKGGFWRGVGSFLSPRKELAADQIRDGAQFIDDLAKGFRSGRGGRKRIRLDGDGRFDIAGMAGDAGCSTHEIERRLENRRRETARNAKVYLALGIALLVAWLGQTLRLSMGKGSVLHDVMFLLVLGCFFFLAFNYSFINWQVRTRRLGTVLDFLKTDESWWPR